MKLISRLVFGPWLDCVKINQYLVLNNTRTNGSQLLNLFLPLPNVSVCQNSRANFRGLESHLSFCRCSATRILSLKEVSPVQEAEELPGKLNSDLRGVLVADAPRFEVISSMVNGYRGAAMLTFVLIFDSYFLLNYRHQIETFAN